MTDDPLDGGDLSAPTGVRDGASVEQLVERLVPGLAARLEGAIDEIEVARDGWRIRVRRGWPAMPGSLIGGRPASAVLMPAAGSTSANGAGPSSGAPSMALPHPPRAAAPGTGGRASATSGRLVATAPAVGVFMPRGGVALGTRVQAGDRLGVVDMLGVPQDVVAPADGVLAASLVEPGEGVEYGQELLVIETAS